MTIYVDPSIWPFRGQMYCHMMTDGPVEELHRFADKIGLRRSWFQNKPGIPHYDLSPRKRKIAVAKGAVEVTGREMVEKCIRKSSSQNHTSNLGRTVEDQQLPLWLQDIVSDK